MTAQSNTQNTSLQTVQNRFNEVKRTLQDAAEGIRKAALNDIQLLAQREYRLKGDEMLERIKGIRLKYHGLNTDINMALNPESQKALGSHENAEFKKRLNALVLKLSEAKRALQAFPESGVKKPIGLSRYEKFIKYAPFFLLTLDSVFEAPALRLLVGAMIFSIPSAIALNFLKYFIAKFLNRQIEKATSRQVRILIVCIGLAIFAALAIVMGHMRQGYLEAQGITSSYGPFALGFLSFMLGTGAWIIEYFAHPIREREKDIRKEQTVYDDYAEKLQAVRDIETSIDGLKGEKSNVLGGRIITMENAANLKRFLRSHYEGTVREIQVEYRSCRTEDDGFQTPFITDIPPFEDEEYTYVETLETGEL